MIKSLQVVRIIFGVLSSKVKTRYESRFLILSALLSRAGLRIYDRHLLWMSDQAFLDIWQRFPEATRVIKDRRFVLLSAAESVRNVLGDTAECGVYRGASSFLILASQAQTVGKMHHIFDSFEGLSKPDARDDSSKYPTAFQWSKHDLAVGEDVVRRNLEEFQTFHIYRGWIPSRFTDVAERRFSFVHIDVDLYEPTYESVAFFYPRMTPGGIILCDDYGFRTCPGANRAFDDFFADKPESVIHLTTGQGMLVKQ